MNALKRFADVIAGFFIAFVLIVCIPVIFIGCFHEPSNAPAPVGAPNHPRLRITAHGLLPILKTFYPKAQSLVKGDYVLLVPGVEAQIPADAEIDVSQEDDGRVTISFPNGQRIRIDRTILGFIPVQGTESVKSMTIDAEGVDLDLAGFIRGVRLEAAE